MFVTVPFDCTGGVLMMNSVSEPGAGEKADVWWVHSHERKCSQGVASDGTQRSEQTH